MWGGTVVIPVAFQASESSALKQYIQYAMLPSRVQLIEYEVESPSFPINALRNTAVKNCDATHVVVMNSFLIPSYGLYDALFSIPLQILNDPRHAVAIPIFPLGISALPCDTWYSCQNSANYFGAVGKKQLYSCVNWGPCRLPYHTTKYPVVDKTWYSIGPSNDSTPLTCWPSDDFDPVLLVRKSEHMPMFDLRLDMLGTSTLEWVSAIRYSGFNFHVLSHGWALEVLNGIDKDREGEASRLSLYQKFYPRLVKAIRRSIRKKYATVNSLPLC